MQENLLLQRYLLRGQILTTVKRDDGLIYGTSLQWEEIGRTPDRLTLRARVLEAITTEGYDPASFEGQLLAPFFEVWAAGVTYKRSESGRREESSTPDIYTRIYQAAFAEPWQGPAPAEGDWEEWKKYSNVGRPELFAKAPLPRYVTGPGEVIRIRKDSGWNVPETELGVLFSPTGQILGWTVIDDMSSRDIEGGNPLYLPQAKEYDQCCGVGPGILIADEDELPDETEIKMTITRGDEVVWDDQTSVGQMARKPADLGPWLFRDHTFPDGVLLSTGTGIVPKPGSKFTLHPGDRITMTIPIIGTLEQVVVQG